MAFVIGAFVLLLVVSYLLARPLVLGGDGADPAADAARARDELAARLAELDLELQTGTLDEDDHRALRREALRRASELIERAGPIAHPATGGPSGDDVEALVSARRRQLEDLACPGCGAAHEPDDHFCRHCGAVLTPASVR